MKCALDDAATILPKTRRTSAMKVKLASRILAAAAKGERDPIQLRIAALLEIVDDWDTVTEPRQQPRYSKGTSHEQTIVSFGTFNTLTANRRCPNLSAITASQEAGAASREVTRYAARYKPQEKLATDRPDDLRTE
jgi:hypothetical protein